MQLFIPPFLVLFFSVIVIYLNEFGVFFFYTVIAMGIITPFILIEKYFIMKWKVIIIGICAFITYLLVIILAFSYTFEGLHPLIEVFPPLGFFHSFIIHYIEAILIATISYGYLFGLERLLDYIGKNYIDFRRWLPIYDRSVYSNTGFFPTPIRARDGSGRLPCGGRDHPYQRYGMRRYFTVAMYSS